MTYEEHEAARDKEDKLRDDAREAAIADAEEYRHDEDDDE